MPKRITPEGYVKKAVWDYLCLRGYKPGITLFRMNAGAMFGEHNGRKWRVAMAEPGTADLMVLKDERIFSSDGEFGFKPLWLELKAEKGKQSPAQVEFQKRVEAEGHKYAVVRSIDDVKALGL